MRYILDFGVANAGQVPAWTYFRNSDTGAALSQPTIVERGGGEFYFDWDWTATTVTAVSFKAICNGIELSDVITSTEVSSAAGVGSAGAAATPWLKTAGNVINQAAVEVLGVSESIDPYASTDANFIQLRSQLNSVGQELILARDWPVLIKECTITGTGTDTAFNLPADFLRMKDDSGWNRTSQWPMYGPVHSAGWQYLKARSISATIGTYYRMVQGQIVFYEAPALASVVAFDYVSRFWCKTNGSESADKYQPSASSDTIMLEPSLVVAGLKYRFCVAKGLPAEGALADYRGAMVATANLEPAVTLDLTYGSLFRDRLVDECNYPETGLGT